MASSDSPSHGPSSISDEQERKKLRNRLSQRAFRRRQAECIRELRSRANVDQRPDSERVEALQRENRRLRTQLVEVQSRLGRLLASVQGLTDSVASTLDGGEGEKEGGSEDVVLGETMRTRRRDSLENLNQVQGISTAPSDIKQITEPTDALVSFRPPIPQDTIDKPIFPGPQTPMFGSGPLYQQIPNIWSFEYQMGLEPYMDAMAASHDASSMLGKEWIHSNSPFSDHIHVLQCLLKDKFSMMGVSPELQGPTQSLYQPVLMVLSMFNSMTRPDVMAWYAKTRFFHIIELTAWQLYPSMGTFEKLHERYRPTDAQLKNPHPLVIDWIPFPSIRDRLIQLHAANPRIDQIFCDAVTGYVVEALMCDLIQGAPAAKVYVRVTDLITAMSSPSPSTSSPVKLPAPDVSSLFTSPAYAAAAFKFLNMDRGASYYKIDPAFFGKYPELYDSVGHMTAGGIPLKPDMQVCLTYPKPLNASTVETYRSFIHFSLDAYTSRYPSAEELVKSSFKFHHIFAMSESFTADRKEQYSFSDDYGEGAHPQVLKAIFTSNYTQEAGYGGDTYCDLARQRIRIHLGQDDVGVFFVPSGTSANAISIAACLRPHEAVIAASSGHIVTRETGAVEASGHKIINATPCNGKLTPEIISKALDENWHFPHMAKPRMVYISNATEFGTVYTREELRAIKDLCGKKNLLLFLDGARIGTALASKANDMTLRDILELTDIFWIGGTKNGALLGEAVVIKDAELAREFAFYVKQHGSLLAKGRVLGVQFAELFRENLYFELAAQANLAAEKLARGIAAAGFTLYAAPETNQVFAVLPLALIERLQERFSFYVWEKYGDGQAVVRLLTTWATHEREVEAFAGTVKDWSEGMQVRARL
ncbi:pyridoxal phosphate-dependent transferase [Dactylonectria macrodidyma]|uniref:Pyridoxal phosphate-dependent transferase n=1 Tax=Dactylonectria macrodidyma TaxID=307937 RepID=A0A9P9IM28_9HYPO|nr:pyridoxal phosphate-dependent transferase [Dactylonectria macrodidyma]